MSSLRTFILLALMASPLHAAPDALTQRFAQCAGRMSAEMEFAWLIGGTGEQARLFRAHLEDLLEAVATPGDGRAILDMRIRAKYAQATLLTRSQFNDDAQDAARAARLAARYSDACRAILTG